MEVVSFLAKLNKQGVDDKICKVEIEMGKKTSGVVRLKVKMRIHHTKEYEGEKGEKGGMVDREKETR